MQNNKENKYIYHNKGYTFKALSYELNYSVTDGILESGAILDESINMVLYIGGPTGGKSTVTVSVNETREYIMNLNFYNNTNNTVGSFKIDVNNISTNIVYKTIDAVVGVISIKLMLNEGVNTIKFYGNENSYAPFLGSFTLRKNTVPSIEVNYYVKDGELKNGAKLNTRRNMVSGIGGTNKGFAIVSIKVNEEGKYNLFLNYRMGCRPFKMDINEVINENIYITPSGEWGVFKTVIQLKSGLNTIKFYGLNEYEASLLGSFTLVKVLPPKVRSLPEGTYDISEGILENGAIIDPLTNFVTNLGGELDGLVKVNFYINMAGKYNLALDYLSENMNNAFKVIVNGVNLGYYFPPTTEGKDLSNVNIFTFPINLKVGTNEIIFHGDGINECPDLGKFSIKFISPPTSKVTLDSYEYKNLNSLKFDDLISVLKSINFIEIPELYEFTPDSKLFYENKDRIEAIINALKDSGNTFNLDKNEGLETLCEVLRSAYYLSKNHSELSYLNNVDFKAKYFLAIKAVQKNPNFKLIYGVDNKVIKAIAKLIEYAHLDMEVLNSFVPILEQFRANIKIDNKEFKKRDTIFMIIKAIGKKLNEGLNENNKKSESTPYYGNIDKFLSSMENLAMEGNNAPNYSERLFINIIYFVGNLSKFRKDKKISQEVLTNCSKKYNYLSKPYIEALTALKLYFNELFFDGTSIEYDKKIEEAKNKYTPKIYKFDDENMIIRAGDKISEERIKKFYWAAQEVKAQFFRVIGTTIPVSTNFFSGIKVDDEELTNFDALEDSQHEEEDDDEEFIDISLNFPLNIVIYNSFEDYKANLRLYGFNTHKTLGVYFSFIKMLFSSDHGVYRGSHSIEKTFKHEYTHYLYDVYGTAIGEYSEYTTWLWEGLAELFAGSTRKEGIKIIKSIITLLSKQKLKSIEELIKYKTKTEDPYRDFVYDDYYAFIHYLFNNRREAINILNTFTRNDDEVSLKAYVDTMKKDSLLNMNYERSAKDLIENLESLENPTTSDDYIINHKNRSMNKIKSDILSIINLEDVTTNIEKSDLFKTFTLVGTYLGGISVDKVTDEKIMDKGVDNVLNLLEKKNWSGYKTVTAYFTDYEVNKDNRVKFKITFHGFLTNN